MLNPARPSPAWLIYKGMTFDKTLVFKDSAGEPIDLTGRTYHLVGKETPDAETDVFDLTDGNGLTVTPLEGKVYFAIPYGSTVNYTADQIHITLYYEQGGKRYPQIVGQVPVSREAFP